MKRSLLPLLLLALLALLSCTTGCTRNQMIDLAMKGAPRDAHPRGMRVDDRVVLAGDLHCHVMPPDSPSHVSRELPETLRLAREEALDFVVLTPHVPANFAGDDEMRAWVEQTQTVLRSRLALEAPEMLVVPGFEYTDHTWGHLGMAFADVRDVLAAVPAAEARRAPVRFFEEWVAKGGVLTINHPVNLPLKDPPISQLGYDMSWRAFHGRAAPEEIAWVSTHAQTIETFNASLTHLRDQFFVGDEERSLRVASHLVDRLARHQQRRIASVGGSDSHGDWLRATTYVLASERSIPALRDGLVGGRTCVRGPEACTLAVRAKGTAAWSYVGDALPADARPKTDPDADVIEARATGGDVTLFVDNEIVATAESGALMTTRLPRGRCAVVRAVVGRSWSSGVYVGCGM